MNRIARAEEILSAAKARHPGACLPGGATSPADQLGTLSLPHELIAACDAAARAEAHLRELTQRPAPTSAQPARTSAVRSA